MFKTGVELHWSACGGLQRVVSLRPGPEKARKTVQVPPALQPLRGESKARSWDGTVVIFSAARRARDAN